jgi:hypothetical protein
MKVPAIIAASIICLVVGVGAGVLLVHYTGELDISRFWKEEEKKGLELRPLPGNPVPAGVPGPPGAGMKGKGGPKGPSSKTQLVNLVAKLDRLTEKPLAVTLDEDEKTKVNEQLKDLGSMDELKEDEAKQKLDGLLEALAKHKQDLESAGVSFGGKGGKMGKEAPNPFKDEPNAAHLQSLQKRLGAPAEKEKN